MGNKFALSKSVNEFFTIISAIIATYFYYPNLDKNFVSKNQTIKENLKESLENKESTTYKQYKLYTNSINKLKRICKKDYYQK